MMYLWELNEIFLVTVELIDGWPHTPDPVVAFTDYDDAVAYVKAANVYYNKGTERHRYAIYQDEIELNPKMPGEE